MDTTNTHIHERSLSWFGTSTSIKSGGVRNTCKYMCIQFDSTKEFMFF
jgi:hypothetical protein